MVNCNKKVRKLLDSEGKLIAFHLTLIFFIKILLHVISTEIETIFPLMILFIKLWLT